MSFFTRVGNHRLSLERHSSWQTDSTRWQYTPCRVLVLMPQYCSVLANFVRLATYASRTPQTNSARWLYVQCTHHAECTALLVLMHQCNDWQFSYCKSNECNNTTCSVSATFVRLAVYASRTPQWIKSHSIQMGLVSASSLTFLSPVLVSSYTYICKSVKVSDNFLRVT